jgi:hypothetical protein
MAASAPTPTPPTTPPTITHLGTRRLVILLLGTALVVAAFVAPWWTRGLTLNHDCAYGDPATNTDCNRGSGPSGVGFGVPGVEGLFLNYGPFHTPTANGVGTDASRETAVSVLGVGALLGTLFMGASLAVRGLVATGRASASPNLPVRLAIFAFSAGLFTVLWGAFFLPLLGNGPGMLWGSNFAGSPFGTGNLVYDSRYANVGFYAGILAFVALPAWVWVDAHQARASTGWAVSKWEAAKPVTNAAN